MVEKSVSINSKNNNNHNQKRRWGGQIDLKKKTEAEYLFRGDNEETVQKNSEKGIHKNNW